MSSSASLLKKRKDSLGKRQEEHGIFKDSAKLFQELIASCDGRDYYPIHIFSANELIKAMEEGFCRRSDDLISHYRGAYQDRKVCIKIYNQLKQKNLFINEVVSLAQINHRNVVKLLGCCFEMQSPMTVYELLPNTLYDLLRTEDPSNQISWDNRLRIAMEIADAVTYLHIAKPRPIIHRDINSKSILLDEHCRPKLCSFSQAVAIPLGETQVATFQMSASFGYMEPDYLSTGIVTEKVDVYSFGWVMFEILSRKGPRELAEFEERHQWDFSQYPSPERIKEVVLKIVKRLALISDAGLLVDTRKFEQLMACVELAGRCIAREPDQRPTMKEVALKFRQIEKHQLPCSSSASSSSL